MTAILQLGRYGDILNALPIALHLFEKTGDKPGFIVSKAYSEILEGVDYVVPEVFNGPFQCVNEARDAFSHKYPEIMVSQVYGRNWGCNAKHESFCKDSWERIGLADSFGKIPLLFTNRNPSREQKAVSELIKGDTILVNLSGNSSPFPAKERFMAHLTASWGWKNVVDLSGVRLERYYDLLGLFDAAKLIITSDTSTLHLCRATETPNIQFIVNTPTMWHGSVPCGNNVLSVRYPDVMKSTGLINKEISKVLCP